ncbi:hypothetical protein LUW74_06385 [Actinomadura madurae]|uniref:hypothetical protein n=1 Tax=Actinomadura madurae TaxID=1993 RepID=UPI002027098C|nr:hypothetical protein [Actinomadura madurae]URN03004.1 hypothetical protein LUW74_06385 [Actinomadura madurae]
MATRVAAGQRLRAGTRSAAQQALAAVAATRPGDGGDVQSGRNPRASAVRDIASSPATT